MISEGGWRRDGGVGEPEVVEGMQVNVGIWNNHGSWLAGFRRSCFGVDRSGGIWLGTNGGSRESDRTMSLA